VKRTKGEDREDWIKEKKTNKRRKKTPKCKKKFQAQMMKILTHNNQVHSKTKFRTRSNHQIQKPNSTTPKSKPENK
jgi:hypothetical protein